MYDKILCIRVLAIGAPMCFIIPCMNVVGIGDPIEH